MAADQSLAALFAAARIGHEAIYDLHSELVDRGLPSRESRSLLAESAEITLTDMPAVAARARRLEVRWQEQRVLDPTGASPTYEAVAAEVAHVEPMLRGRLDRLRRIAARLQELLDE
jgi:hypothetical protein